MKTRGTLGFTLIELIVVVTIIGVLSAVSTFSYRSSLVGSRDTRRKADIEQIRAALELYRSNNNVYPATASFSLDCASTGGLTDAGGNTYLSSKPKDPRCTTQTYNYTQLLSGADYTLGAMLEVPDTSSCGDCSATTGTQACNYCMGPYGKK